MFYSEVLDVFFNCYTFNTEVQSIVAQGQKSQLAFFRLVQQWILRTNRPSLALLSETMECGICLLSQKPLEPMTLMKCGHCCGTFDLEALSDAYLQGEVYVVPVSQELVDGVGQGEWVCLYCMREDSTAIHSHSLSATNSHHGRNANASSCISANTASAIGNTTGGSLVNEFGPSLSFPWQLNPTLSLAAAQHAALSPPLCIMLQALALLADTSLTNIVPSTRVRESRQADDAKDISAMDAAAHGLRLWTLQERLIILHALVLCFDACPKQAKKMEFLFTQVERLRKIAARPGM